MFEIGSKYRTKGGWTNGTVFSDGEIVVIEEKSGRADNYHVRSIKTKRINRIHSRYLDPLIVLNKIVEDVVEVFDDSNNCLGETNRKELIDFCKQIVTYSLTGYYVIHEERKILLTEALLKELKTTRLNLHKLLKTIQ